MTLRLTKSGRESTARQLGKKHQRHKRPIQDKESQRWLTALLATEQAIDESVRVVTVADQEADIYELFALPRRTNSELLIRAYHNRSVKSFAEPTVEKLQQAIGQSPVCGQLRLELPRQPQRQPRCATLTLRFATVELQLNRESPQVQRSNLGRNSGTPEGWRRPSLFP